MKYLTTAFVITLLLSSIFIIGCGDGDGDNGTKTVNYPPSIEKIKAYGYGIKQGASMPFEVYTKDAESDPLEYTWESSAGEFDTTSETLVTWTAPDTPGNVTITISVSDGQNDPVMRTIDMIVVSDTKPESNILGTWDLDSIDGRYRGTYIEEDKIGVPIKYESVRHVYRADGTYATYVKYRYQFTAKIWLIGDDIFDLSVDVNVTCEYEVTGKYSVEKTTSTGLELTKTESLYESIEKSYNRDRYNDTQKTEIDTLLEGSENMMEQVVTSSDPVELSVEDDEMTSTDLLWDGESLYKRVLVTLEETE